MEIAIFNGSHIGVDRIIGRCSLNPLTCLCLCPRLYSGGGVLVLAVVSVHFESSVLQCVVAGRAHVNKGHMGITVEKYLK